MRPPRGQGPRADRAVRPHPVAARFAADVAACHGRHCPDGCAPSDVAHERRRRARRRVRTGSALRRLLPGSRRVDARSAGVSPTRRTADMIWVETSTPDPAEARSSRSNPRARPGDSCPPTTARRRSTGGRHLSDRQIAAFKADLARLGTASSSSRSLASTRSTSRCSSSRAVTGRGDARLRAPAAGSPSSRPRAIRPPATSARSAPATSTRCSTRSARGSLDTGAERVDRGGRVHRGSER